MIPKNYDVHGKCTRCQEKTSLTSCSCCEYPLCQKCLSNDREKIIDNIQHMFKICQHRIKSIHKKRDQLNELRESNHKKIRQIATIFNDFERQYFEHKQATLNLLNKYNEQITDQFWSKINISIPSTTEPFIDLLNRTEILLKKSQTVKFDDILSVFYNLTALNDQLEQSNTLIETCDVKSLSKQSIEINKNTNNQLDPHICVSLNQKDNNQFS